jgi:hypothetical protein
LRNGILKDAGVPLPAVASFQMFGRGRILAFANSLNLRNNYFRVLYLFAFVVVTSVAYAMGFRRDSLFAIIILGLWPTHLLLVFITMRLFPPDVESTGDFRGILYGSVVAEDASPSIRLPVGADAASEQSTLIAARFRPARNVHGRQGGPYTRRSCAARGCNRPGALDGVDGSEASYLSHGSRAGRDEEWTRGVPREGTHW